MISFQVDTVLLDIEGTTSSIAFVYDVMFAYIREHLHAFLEEHVDSDRVENAIAKMRSDLSDSNWCIRTLERPKRIEIVEQQVLSWMSEDKKSTGLKALQGTIWKEGFEDGTLRAHLFPEVAASLQRWHQQGLDLRIYSSGSIEAQKLFFGHTESGNLLPLFRAHYDTSIGNKRVSSSYSKIADDCLITPSRILFVSDVVAELEAAQEAGMKIVASCRPGNAELPGEYLGPRIESFDELAFG